MPSDTAHAHLEELLGSEIDDCPCGLPHRIPTREADLRSGALERLLEIVDQFFPKGPVLCAADGNTWPVAGEAAVDMLQEHGRKIDVHRTDQPSAPAHADRETVDALVTAVRASGPAGLLAVGSGTINDICKSAATMTDRPLITVATAASMNGYPSAISALTDRGGQNHRTMPTAAGDHRRS